jgi:DnaJ-class molecular chaperone
MALVLLRLLAGGLDGGPGPAEQPPLSCPYCGQPTSDGSDEHDACWEAACAEAEPCPRCGGRGYFGRDEFGVYDGCELCEGTGIDPDDPAFPH